MVNIPNRLELKEALLQSRLTKIHDVDTTVRTVRVGTILDSIYRNSSVAQTWSMLPYELVMYLIENTVNVEMKNYSYFRWNMFGLPAGWQIIFSNNHGYNSRLSEPIRVSFLINADNSKIEKFCNVEIMHCKDHISQILICDWRIKMKIRIFFKRIADFGDFAEGRLYYSMDSVFFNKYRKNISQIDNNVSQFYCHEMMFYKKFPPLDKEFLSCESSYSETEAEKHIEWFRKYFELFQQLLASK